MATQIEEDVSLVIDGQEFKGWQDIEVVIQMDALSRSFRFQMAYDRRGDFPLITPDARCDVYVNGFKRITGYIDDIDSQKNARGHSRSVSGRSITRNLVDCSIHLNTNQLNNVTLEELCRKFCEAHGISVINEAGDLPKIPIVRWADGARYGRIMQDEARKIGVTIRDDENGNIILTRPRNRPSRGAIAEGSGGKELKDSNIEQWRVIRSVQQRFSEYIVKGRSTQTDGQQGNQRRGTATDAGVKSFRPIILKAEGDVTNAICQRRAEHEKQRRLGLSYQVSLTVSGWRHQLDGEPWRVDENVPVSIQSENINQSLLTRRVIHRKTGGGTTTSLDLVDPDTFVAIAKGEAKSDKVEFSAAGLITDLGPPRRIIDTEG